MPNSLANAAIKENLPLLKPDILVVSRTLLPKEGGIEEYIYNRCLQDPERVIVLSSACLGDKYFDEKQNFPIFRWKSPKLFNFVLLGSFIKQFFYMFCELLLAIKIYFRYRYRYIEWGHGYDFPVLLLLSYLLPVRCFIYVHGNDILCPLKNPMLRLLFSCTLNRVEKIVCNSSFTADYLTKNFNFNTSTLVINPVVRPEKFGILNIKNDFENLGKKLRNNYKIQETSIVILSVGRLVPRKGFDKIIQLLPLLLAENIDVHYIVCGRGVMELELKSLASRLNLIDRVHFAGYVPDRELASYYAACDLFAMLTFFDQNAYSIEGFGIVYVEAGYFGKPVIATRVGGVVDAVHDEENGILVDPNSENGILEAFKCLCKDKNLRYSLGLKGQELASRKTLHRQLYLSNKIEEENAKSNDLYIS
ncbi:group 1 glycosyl transferase [Nostoc carneum NIES-2107]|nr:group 1 glycosyl transferase [Nostoc carneum NIES-2107]